MSTKTIEEIKKLSSEELKKMGLITIEENNRLVEEVNKWHIHTLLTLYPNGGEVIKAIYQLIYDHKIRFKIDTDHWDIYRWEVSFSKSFLDAIGEHGYIEELANFIKEKACSDIKRHYFDIEKNKKYQEVI